MLWRSISFKSSKKRNRQALVDVLLVSYNFPSWRGNIEEDSSDEYNSSFVDIIGNSNIRRKEKFIFIVIDYIVN